jgi:hypothetical protein
MQVVVREAIGTNIVPAVQHMRTLKDIKADGTREVFVYRSDKQMLRESHGKRRG